MCVCVCGFASKFHRTMDTSNKMTGHNFRPRLYIPAMPARSEQEKGFVGTSSDGGTRLGDSPEKREPPIPGVGSQ